MAAIGPHLITEIPGPRSRSLGEELGRYECRNVVWRTPDFPIFLEKGEGVHLWDVDGNRFVDWTSAFAVAGLGHRAEPVRAALERQCGELWHAMGDVHPAANRAALCRRLSEVTFERWGLGPGKVFLANSGFEAVEIAMKTAWLHSHRAGVIAFQGGYHGLGFGATEVTGWPVFREPFRGLLPKLVHLVPFPHCCRCPYQVQEGYRLEGEPFPNCSTSCLGKIEAEIRELLQRKSIGAILVEPCLGRGGDVLPPRDFLPMLRRICDETKTLLILDEIYTGFNRTGKLFACEWFDVIPDLVCVGKALSGGFPISACIGRREVMDAWPESRGEALHTTTHLGNPIGSAMALAAIEAHLDPATSRLVRERGRCLQENLRRLELHPAVAQVRGVGLMQAVEFRDQPGLPAAERVGGLMTQGLKAGLILLGGGREGGCLSLTPPFGIAEEEIVGLVDWLQERIA